MLCISTRVLKEIKIWSNLNSHEFFGVSIIGGLYIVVLVSVLLDIKVVLNKKWGCFNFITNLAYIERSGQNVLFW